MFAASRVYLASRSEIAIHLERSLIFAENVDLRMPATNSSSRPDWQRNALFKFFASLKLAVILLAVLILAAIAATRYESSFDAKVARAYTYGPPWVNLWLMLLGANVPACACS